MKVVNKWNKKNYRLVSKSEKDVVLEREDGSQFKIAMSEFYANYYAKDEK